MIQGRLALDWVVELGARAGERAAAQREELLRARVTHCAHGNAGAAQAAQVPPARWILHEAARLVPGERLRACGVHG